MKRPILTEFQRKLIIHFPNTLFSESLQLRISQLKFKRSIGNEIDKILKFFGYGKTKKR